MSRRRGKLYRTLTTRIALAAIGGVAIASAGIFAFDALVLKAVYTTRPTDYLYLVPFTLVGVLAGVVAAHTLARNITDPVQSLASAARRIAVNDLSARADATNDTMNEVQDLVRDFNHMAARLERLANERKGVREFIAHELRTPLTILRGRLQGALDGVYPIDTQLAEVCLVQIETLGRVMGDLAALENVEGHVFIRSQTVALDVVLGEVRDAFDGALREAGFSPEWRLEPIHLRIDPDRVRQAVVAAIQNIIVHANPGPVRVSLDRRETMALIAIADSGPGIGEANPEVLFEPFRRGQTRGAGSGVGLTLIKYAVEGHGGQATIRRSELGGCEIQIRLPLAS